MNVPEKLRYTSDHEWVRIKGDVATVGITDHAQEELSDVVFVELPVVGQAVGLGDPIAVVESVKAASDIYAPITGEVVEINPFSRWCHFFVLDTSMTGLFLGGARCCAPEFPYPGD